mmetsp:Transcript_122132/g.390606  ORF Transcript_122132/g.390606 Transcript_122132/m.390606 type:complete len:241 (+) Transcript_122132:729-1451(+)
MLHDHHLAIVHLQPIRHRGRRRQNLHAELRQQALPEDIEVQQTQEAATEAGSQHRRDVAAGLHGGIGEQQPLHSNFQLLPVADVLREDARVDHRLSSSEAWECLASLLRAIGKNGFAHSETSDILGTHGDVANLAASKHIQRLGIRVQNAHLMHAIRPLAVGTVYLLSFLQLAIAYCNKQHHASCVVEPRVEEQRFERCVKTSCRRRHFRHDRLKQGGDTFARLAAHLQYLVFGHRGEPQ